MKRPTRLIIKDCDKTVWNKICLKFIVSDDEFMLSRKHLRIFNFTKPDTFPDNLVPSSGENNTFNKTSLYILRTQLEKKIPKKINIKAVKNI